MESTTLVNLSHLRLFTMGDTDVEQVMLAEIISELTIESDQITNLVAKKDWHTLSRVTHKLKTTLPFVGNQDLIDLNMKIETASRTNSDLDCIPEWSAQFLQVLPEVTRELEGMLD